MGNTEKIAISLPTEVYREVEKARKATAETRSAFIRRAIELALKDREQKALIKKYVDGYEKNPETEEEVNAAQASAAALFAEEPWE